MVGWSIQFKILFDRSTNVSYFNVIKRKKTRRRKGFEIVAPFFLNHVERGRSSPRERNDPRKWRARQPYDLAPILTARAFEAPSSLADTPARSHFTVEQRVALDSSWRTVFHSFGFRSSFKRISSKARPIDRTGTRSSCCRQLVPSFVLLPLFPIRVQLETWFDPKGNEKGEKLLIFLFYATIRVTCPRYSTSPLAIFYYSNWLFKLWQAWTRNTNRFPRKWNTSIALHLLNNT